METVAATVDGVSFALRRDAAAPGVPDSSWLTEWGEVFAVFDKQDSGNLSFGMRQGGQRRFIKYVGAWTIESHS